MARRSKSGYGQRGGKGIHTGLKKRTFEGKTEDGYVLRSRSFCQEPKAWMKIYRIGNHWESGTVRPQKMDWTGPDGRNDWIECILIK